VAAFGEAMTDFTKLTAVEISGLLQQAKDDVESKRAEMKVLIGSRYQDIIEASDRCAGMHQDAKKVQQLIKDIPEQCTQLREATRKSAPDAENGVEVMGERVKCILDAREKIWKCLGHSDFLSAAIVYIKASEAFALLSANNALQRFPFLHQQWASLKHMSKTILQSATDLLECQDESSEESVAGALFVHVVLADSTYAQVIDIFLASRETWMQTLTDSETLSAKSVGERMLQSIKTLKSTALQSAAMFTKSAKGDPAIEKYAQKWATVTKGFTCDLCQRNAGTNSSFSDDLVQRRFKVWFANQQKKLSDRCPALMLDFADIEDLTRAQQSIVEVNAELVGDGPHVEIWAAACKSVLKQAESVDLWVVVFRPLFVAQTDKLLQVSLHSSYRQIHEQLAETERTTVPSQMISNLQQSLQFLLENCSKLDGKSAELQGILQRHCSVVAILLLTQIQKRKSALQDQVAKVLEEGSADEGGPAGELLFLGQLCWALAKSCPALFEIVPCGGDDLTDLITDDELSSVQQTVEGVTDPSSAPPTGMLRSAKKALRAAGKTKGSVDGASDLQQIFQDCSYSSLGAWTEWAANMVAKSIEQNVFETEDWTQSEVSWRSQHASWEQVTIAEDAEDGESLEETVWLPSSASAPIMVMLFSLAIQLQHVCAAEQKAVASVQESSSSSSLVDQQLLAQMLCKAAYAVVVQIHTKLCIETSLTSKASEAAVLQLLFDISFAQSVLCGSSATESGKGATELLESLETRLDPVDWELYGPLLHQRVQKHISSCSLLFAAVGAFTKKTRSEEGSKTVPSAPLSEHHQTVPLAPRMARFSLLPAPRRLRSDGNETNTSKSGARTEARRDDTEKGQKGSFMGKAGSLLKSFGGGGFF
jgi:hypothetical protein